MFHDKASLAAHDHFAGTSTAPSRPRRYLAGGIGLLPHSCTLFKYDTLPDALSFTARSLKVGSGVKCIFDKDFVIAEQKLTVEPGKLTLVCGHWHPDYSGFDFAACAPASCYATLLVQDSMETEDDLPGSFGIIDSWALAYNMLCAGHDIAVDLTLLRPAGSSKADGYNVTSSGPASFALVYKAIAEHVQQRTMLSLLQLLGTLNAVILKGGHKKGIVTSMMHTKCQHIHEYIDSPVALLDGSHKKGFIIDKQTATAAKHAELRKKIYRSVNEESSFLQKEAKGLYSNVCVGIMLPDRGTCLIWRVNLGLVQTRQELIDAYVKVTEQIVSLHKIWHDEVSNSPLLRNLWRPLNEDCQVGIDPVGLANFLAVRGVSYAEFVEQLKAESGYGEWFATAYRASTQRAQELAKELGLPKFVRLHTVEPAQSHSFELQDSQGYTLCRGIWPPFATVVNRASENEKSVTVDHGDVETVADVGPEVIFELNDAWMRMMQKHGLAHAISADSYETMMDETFARWWNSSLLTQYYQFAGSYDQSYARKSVEEIALPSRESGGIACACGE